MTTQKKNNLLRRHEVMLMLQKESSPSMSIASEHVANHFKVSQDVVAVKNIKNKYGTRDFMIEAFVYDNVDAKNKVEPKPKVKKGEGNN